MSHLPCLHSSFQGKVSSLTGYRPSSVVQRCTGGLLITCKESRIGKAPVAVPQGVQIQQDGLRFTVKVCHCSYGAYYKHRSASWADHHTLPYGEATVLAAASFSLSGCCLQGPKGELTKTFSPLVKFDTLVRLHFGLADSERSPAQLFSTYTRDYASFSGLLCRRMAHIGSTERKTRVRPTFSMVLQGKLLSR